MTDAETPKPSKLKSRAALTTKLIAAIGTLTVAINGYMDLQEQNQLVLQALGSKLNNLSQRVARMEGFVVGVTMEKASADTPAKPIRYDDDFPEPIEEHAVAVVAAEIPEDELEMVEVMAAPEPAPKKVKKAKLNIDAYEDVPMDMDSLEQMQVQAQEEFDDLEADLAAMEKETHDG